MRDEVQAEGLVRNIGNFARFLETISFSHTEVLNIAEVAREAEVGRKSVEGYLSILEDMLLSFTVPVFTKRAKRILIAHPKFYLFDTGIYRSLRPKGPMDKPEEIEGHALEGLVAQHLRSWIAYRGNKNGLYFWRTKSGVEVDFIVYGEDGLWAVEVKRTDRTRAADLKGLRTFGQDYPEAQLLYLYQGKDKLKVGRFMCLPVEDFLLNLRPDRMLAPTP
jgi:predicted AAA+ superfamily ATPase